MEEETFNKIREEIVALGISHFGNFEEINRQSSVIFQRYGTTEAEYDKYLERNLRELRRWRDSGFKDNYKSGPKLKVVGIVLVIVIAVALIVVIAYFRLW